MVLSLGFLAVIGAGVLSVAPMAPQESGAAPGPGDPAALRAGFVGRWTLNRQLSDDPMQKLREAHPQGPGGFGGRGAPGGFGGGRGGPGPGGPGPGGPGGQRARLAPPAEMTVTQLEPELVVVEPDGYVRHLHPDGRKYKAEGGQIEVKTRWDGGQLIVESTRDHGGKVIETWSLAPDKRQLTVQRRVEGRMGNVTVKTVYDGALEGSPPPAPPPVS